MSFLVNPFANALSSLTWEGFFATARIIIIILDVALFLGIIILIWKAWEFRPRLEENFRGTGEDEELTFDHKAILSQWKKLHNDAASAPPHSVTLAVIAADNFVDTILKGMGLEGDSMADRLQKFDPREYHTLEGLWKAHKIRNQLVHTPGFEISEREGSELLKAYEAFLKELGALE